MNGKRSKFLVQVVVLVAILAANLVPVFACHPVVGGDCEKAWAQAVGAEGQMKVWIDDVLVFDDHVSDGWNEEWTEADGYDFCTEHTIRAKYYGIEETAKFGGPYCCPQYNLSLNGTCSGGSATWNADTQAELNVTGTGADGEPVNYTANVGPGNGIKQISWVNPGTYGPHPVSLNGTLKVEGKVVTSASFDDSLVCGMPQGNIEVSVSCNGVQVSGYTDKATDVSWSFNDESGTVSVQAGNFNFTRGIPLTTYGPDLDGSATMTVGGTLYEDSDELSSAICGPLPNYHVNSYAGCDKGEASVVTNVAGTIEWSIVKNGDDMSSGSEHVTKDTDKLVQWNLKDWGPYALRVWIKFTPDDTKLKPVEDEADERDVHCGPPEQPSCDSWTVQPSQGRVPLVVSGKGSYTDPDKQVVVGVVDWGDGTRYLALPINDVHHTYVLTGEFTSQLTLLLWDGGEITSQACRAVVKVNEPPPEQPTCDNLVLNPTSGQIPYTQTGTTSYTDVDSLVKSFRIDWGNEDPDYKGTSKSASHSVDQTGSFTAQAYLVLADGSEVTSNTCKASYTAEEVAPDFSVESLCRTDGKGMIQISNRGPGSIIALIYWHDGKRRETLAIPENTSASSVSAEILYEAVQVEVVVTPREGTDRLTLTVGPCAGRKAPKTTVRCLLRSEDTRHNDPPYQWHCDVVGDNNGRIRDLRIEILLYESRPTEEGGPVLLQDAWFTSAGASTDDPSKKAVTTQILGNKVIHLVVGVGNETNKLGVGSSISGDGFWTPDLTGKAKKVDIMLHATWVDDFSGMLGGETAGDTVEISEYHVEPDGKERQWLDEQTRTYKVQKGDTLIQIGLWTGIPALRIAEANGIEDPNLIEAGAILVIPEPLLSTA